jgi:hypothetical protein
MLWRVDAVGMVITREDQPYHVALPWTSVSAVSSKANAVTCGRA